MGDLDSKRDKNICRPSWSGVVLHIMDSSKSQELEGGHPCKVVPQLLNWSPFHPSQGMEPCPHEKFSPKR